MMPRVARLILGLSMAVFGLTGSIDAQLFTLGKDDMIKWTSENPYERFPDGRPKVPEWLMERARGLSAEEVLAVLPGKNYRNQFANGFQVLHPGQKLVGRAFTVQFMPVRPDLDSVIAARAKAAGFDRMNNQTAIDMLQPGDVLVVDLFGQGEGGTIVGDNLFYYINKATKGAGLVVDGAIRDLDGISEIDMPAYFRKAHPSAIANVIVSGVNVPTLWRTSTPFRHALLLAGAHLGRRRTGVAVERAGVLGDGPPRPRRLDGALDHAGRERRHHAVEPESDAAARGHAQPGHRLRAIVRNEPRPQRGGVEWPERW